MDTDPPSPGARGLTGLSRRTAGPAGAAILALPLILTGCAGKSGTSEAPDHLVWATSEAPTSLDIAHGFDNASTLVLDEVLETPLKIDSDGRYVPGLAQSWMVPVPGTYVFRFRSGIKFSDGTPMTAGDVAYSLGRHLDPNVASQAASIVRDVKSVKVTGPDTVTVVLNRPSTSILAAAATVWTVVPRRMAEQHPKDLGSPDVGIVGTGPYKVKTFSLSSGTTLVRNDAHWDKRAPFAQIQVKTITDPEALRLAVGSGSIDGTWDALPKDFHKWKSLHNVRTMYGPSDGISYLTFDTTDSRLSDLHVRRAIAYAVDRDAIRRLMVGERGRLASTILPLPQLSAVYGGQMAEVVGKMHAYPHDLKAAKAELAASKYPGGFEMKIPYDAGGDTLAMQAIVSDLAKIGIRLTLQPLPPAAYYARSDNHDHVGLQIQNLSDSTPDPVEGLPDMLGQAAKEAQGGNNAMYGSADLDDRISRMLAAEGAARRDLVTSILSEVADQVPYLPLFHRDWTLALNKRFTANPNVWTSGRLRDIRPAGH